MKCLMCRKECRRRGNSKFCSKSCRIRYANDKEARQYKMYGDMIVDRQFAEPKKVVEYRCPGCGCMVILRPCMICFVGSTK